ncbi:MAG: 16S rRNA (guanine(527)-N(7))-methyltransferase RsmG [Epsilonproteobacteria bacterium]|nr:16S rRNA (guanine(527)-N(7))-methyltransferase RsmG [Campylobacterota bacterium]OIO16052.1 MAG: 16S rRNA (guanine(527)-N(7))-methyltransferase RsmG [Helicobacteraceae bacterium CG1_02_36_14]PIP10236.1 MAG: 16S rRNA (guanine(527)-N(7))-methyltransferase RsmG [Sulfurimonas sp. CG23_combo_of_CG06-09_8_20_14_all_36_33]PIS26445.1 MAG: 16S rRNA (guanine(527)-N(7))-methyltransferase RsmG [Sulfurimonas sp. CG08_land_8_20_14_0_20_36_33]PIU33907.1 MAG: 16S rRNA (guanine(527)-N(7))-methyltransferase Rs
MDLKSALLEDKILLPENFFYNIQKYKEHLFKWNKIHNLTGAKDEKTLNEFIYDSVFPVSFLPKVKSILDIGTGAGFPGMILAFALPDTQVTLAEPLAKRASFLQFIKADLGLENVTVVKKRVEEMPTQIFELITSRAVTDTKMLLQLSENFRDENSKLLFYKGERVFDEVDESMPHKIVQTKKRHYLLLGEE